MKIYKRGMLQRLLIILVILYSVMPIVSRVISTYLSTYFYMLVLVLLAVIIVFANRKRSLNRNAYFLLPFLGWKMLTLFITGESMIMWGYQSLIELIPIIIGVYILQYRRQEISMYGKVIVSAFIVTIVTTIVGLISNPGAARWLATVSSPDDPRYIMYGMQNMGGYELIYSVILLYPLVVFAYKQKKLNVVQTLCLSIGIFFLVLLSEYTTAFLLFLLTTLLFLVKRDLRKSHLVLLMIVAVIFSVLFSNAISQLLTGLAELLDSEIISTRLQALAGGRTGLETAEDNRMGLYLKSLNTFLSHPLFGTFLQGGTGIGGHSFILDMLAQYGMLGVAVLFCMYRKIYTLFYKQYSNRQGYGYVLWTFWQTLFLSCINTGMWLYVLTLYVPIILWIIYGVGEKSNENIVDCQYGS